MDENVHDVLRSQMRTIALILFMPLSALSAGATAAFAVGCSDSAILIEEAERTLPANPARSEELLLEALWMCPESAAIRYDLALVYYELGRYAESEAALREAVGVRPDYAKALNALAYVMLTKTGGDRDEAGMYAKAASELEPGNAEYADTLALAGSFSFPPLLKLSAIFKETNGNGILESGEEGAVSVRISNEGQGGSGALRIMLVPDASAAGLDFDPETDIVSVSKGGVRNAELKIRAPRAGMAAGMANFTLKAEEAGGFNPEHKKISIAVKPVPLPELRARADSFADAGGDGNISRAEAFTVNITIENAGQGEARGVTAGMKAGGGLGIDEGVISLGTIKPGESRRLSYTFKPGPDARSLSASLSVSEERPGFGFTMPVLMAFDTPAEKLASLNRDAVSAPEERRRTFGQNADSGGGLGLVVSASSGGGADIEGPRPFAAPWMRALVAAMPGYGGEGVRLFEDADGNEIQAIFGPGGLLNRMAEDGSRNIIVYISSDARVSNDGLALKAGPAEYPLKDVLESLERLSLERSPETIAVMLDLRLAEGARIEDAALKKLIPPDSPLFLRGGCVMVAGLDYSGLRRGFFARTFYSSLADALEARSELSAGAFEEALMSGAARGAMDFGIYLAGDKGLRIVKKPETK